MVAKLTCTQKGMNQKLTSAQEVGTPVTHDRKNHLQIFNGKLKKKKVFKDDLCLTIINKVRQRKGVISDKSWKTGSEGFCDLH